MVPFDGIDNLYLLSPQPKERVPGALFNVAFGMEVVQPSSPRAYNGPQAAEFWLFDSFEGVPNPPKDGREASSWLRQKSLENCGLSGILWARKKTF